MTDKTIFEQIRDREINSVFLYEDDQIFAIHDVNPVAPIHVLIIPKKKIETINDINDDDKELIGHMFLTAKKIAFELGIKDDGYRVVFNTNKDGGQSVYHIHLHLLGGRQMVWPPG
jgi:histidine triad (HIT) family protein|tara:strand:- start:1582 stop:1929 length:348 start_codon:yes stop_codon:yes gene_type:complete